MNVWHVLAKELLGAARDRRTLLVVLVFPLVLYPLMFGVQGHFQSRAREQRAALVPQVLLVGGADVPALSAFLEGSTVLLRYEALQDALAALKAGLGHAVLEVPPGFERRLGEQPAPRLRLHFSPDDEDAPAAAAKLEGLLRAFADRWVAERLAEAGLSAKLLTPFQTDEVPLSGSGASPVVVALLPFLIVVMITGGAMAVGAEITAGEKERGTIATLLVSQLSRTEIVLGKFLTVLAVSLVSSVVSLVGLSFGVGILARSLAQGTATTAGLSLSPTLLLWMFLVLVPLAAMLSALILIVGTFARNEKEANVYASPLYFVIIILGIVTTTQGLEMRGAKFLIPVVSSLTALQEVMRGAPDWGHLGLTVVSSLGMAAALIALSVALFKRESVLFRL